MYQGGRHVPCPIYRAFLPFGAGHPHHFFRSVKPKSSPTDSSLPRSGSRAALASSAARKRTDVECHTFQVCSIRGCLRTGSCNTSRHRTACDFSNNRSRAGSENTTNGLHQIPCSRNQDSARRNRAEYTDGDLPVSLIREDSIARRISIDDCRDIIHFLRVHDAPTCRRLEGILAENGQRATDTANPCGSPSTNRHKQNLTDKKYYSYPNGTYINPDSATTSLKSLADDFSL